MQFGKKNILWVKIFLQNIELAHKNASFSLASPKLPCSLHGKANFKLSQERQVTSSSFSVPQSWLHQKLWAEKWSRNTLSCSPICCSMDGRDSPAGTRGSGKAALLSHLGLGWNLCSTTNSLYDLEQILSKLSETQNLQ